MEIVWAVVELCQRSRLVRVQPRRGVAKGDPAHLDEAGQAFDAEPAKILPWVTHVPVSGNEAPDSIENFRSLGRVRRRAVGSSAKSRTLILAARRLSVRSSADCLI